MHYINLSAETENTYDISKFLALAGDNYDPLNSAIFRYLDKVPSGETYTITRFPKRPDIYSADIYDGDTQYWWILMLYNNICNINELKIGTTLNVIPKSLIEDLMLKFSELEKEKL